MLPLAQWRPRRLNRQLPLCFRDVLPKSPMPLPPSGIQLLGGPSNQGASEPHLSCLSPPVPAPCSMFKTQPNKFGLFCVFRSERLPSHDPDEQSTNAQSFLSQLPFTANSSIPPIVTSAPDNPFHPYLNESSFRLGDWYWNHGPQKSHENFKLLLDTIGDLEYNPEDVRNTNWRTINKELGSSSDD